MHRSIRSFNIPPRATPQAFEFLQISSFKILAFAVKLVFQYLTQVLDLIVNFFLKGKSANVTFYTLTKPSKLDLVMNSLS